jgi:transmembrane sensor
MDRAKRQPTPQENAAEWYRRMHEDKVSEDTQRAFTAWLDAASEHRTLYDRIDRAWITLKEGAEDPRILALRHETALRLTRRSSPFLPTPRWAPVAPIVVLIIGIVGFTAWKVPSMSNGSSFLTTVMDSLHLGPSNVYTTATGQRLALTLQDGSQVTLDTQSELQVAFSTGERAVHLRRGQAFFEVAKDKKRPFVVEASNRRLIAVGTAFDVRLDREQVKVTMLEGTVRVEPRQPTTPKTSDSATTLTGGVLPSEPVTTLTAGEQLIADPHRDVRVKSADTERATSWRRGRLIFNNTRLADALDEVNRYSEVKVRLTDVTLSDLRLGGGFATGRPDVFVEAVTSYFPVRVSRSDDQTIELSPK